MSVQLVNSLAKKTINRRCSVRSRFVLCLSLFVYLSPLSLAQEAWLEEIIVTAQKRYETVQEVPIAITAFTGEIINDIVA